MQNIMIGFREISKFNVQDIKFGIISFLPLM